MPTLKTLIRNAIPARLQVPVKHLYAQLRGDLEPELAMLPCLIDRGGHAIDVGGNRGAYAYALWKLGARLDVFEPNPDCAAILSAWAANKNGVTVHSVALSEGDGRAQLHVPVDAQGVEHDASASIESTAAGRTRDIDVELRPLDSFGFRQTALIKIDVEGHEASVIRGSAETLRAAGPALIVEIEQRHNRSPIQDVFGLITGFGYRGFFLKGSRLTALEEFDLKRDQPLHAFESGQGEYCNNFLFLHEAALSEGRYAQLFRRWGKA